MIPFLKLLFVKALLFFSIYVSFGVKLQCHFTSKCY